MREVVEYVLLGLIQGATEFLPVSSSGHLVAARELLNMRGPGMLLEVCLHVGTLVAILIVLRSELWKLIIDAPRGALLLLRGRRDAIDTEAPTFRIALAIVVGSVPCAIAGVWLHDAIGRVFENVQASSALLVLTGVILLASRLAQQGQRTTVSPLRGLLIGIAQAAALLPGISRSGTTIVTAYFLGIDRKLAARFSFLLAVPALAGAAVVEMARALNASAADPALTQGEVIGLACGAATAALVGWACLVLLFKVVQKGKLYWFGAYCVPVGILLFALGSRL